MKKTIFVALAISTLFCSCNKEGIETTDNSNHSFSIFANEALTKTTLEGKTVTWADGDALTVFNAETGTTTYSNNCRFNISDISSGLFVKDGDDTGNSLITDKSAYDWYACYPYLPYAGAPGTTKGYTVSLAPKQVGYNNTSHIAVDDIMAGKTLNVSSSETPSIELHHVCALLKFTVTNNSGEAVVFKGLSLDATAGGTYITGSFSMNWGDEGTNPTLDPSNMGSSKSYVSALTIVDEDGNATSEEVADGSSVDMYLCAAPFSVRAGKKIKITILADKGNLELSKTLTSDISFAAGTYNTANLTYTKPASYVFTESFGTKAVNKASVPSYDKSGLSCYNTSDADNYIYAVTGNSSFAISSDINYSDYSLSPAAVKLPASSATADNSGVYIKGITVEPNTTYVFTYDKSKGRLSSATEDYSTTTVFKWRQNGVESWTTVNSTLDSGTISQEFTTGDYTTIDLGVEATDRNPSGTKKYYPALDNFKLAKK